MELQAILTLLSDGEFHSGKALGDLLGVSRTAVWKHLQKLEAYGVPLESVKGKGYRLPGGLELLDADRITNDLTPLARSYLRELVLFESVDSTNRLAMEKAMSGGAGGYVCLAEHQTAGRGRRGRRWQSPYGQSVYLSAVVEFDGGAAALEGLSLAVGVALMRALEKMGVTGVGLKWPNDLLHDGRKLAGILLEMTGDVAGLCQVVVGIGLNVSVAEAGAEEIDQPWVDLATLAPGLSRNELVAKVLSELLSVLMTYQQLGFEGYRDEWESRHVHQNAEVTLSSVAEVNHGRALGVTSTGALRVLVDGREQLFNGGEVSLRSAEHQAGNASGGDGVPT